MLALAACGDDSPTDDAGAGTTGGGGKNGGSGKSGSSGKNGGAGKSGSDAGSAPSTPGDFGAIWKRASSDITIINPTDPGKTVGEEIELPPTIPDPVGGREVDVYHQLVDDKLITYAHLEGDQVYYKFSEAAQRLDDIYISTSLTGDQHLFEIRDGKLTDSGTTQIGDAVVITSATYQKHEGAFPPSTWPKKVYEQDLVAP